MISAFKRSQKVVACFLAVLVAINLIPASALAESGWICDGDIRYQVEKHQMDSGEEITVTAVSDSSATELLGLEMPNGTLVEARGQTVTATYTAYADGDYQFRILYQCNGLIEENGIETASASDAFDRATPSEIVEKASPSDTEPFKDFEDYVGCATRSSASKASTSEAMPSGEDGVYYDEDGEEYIEDWVIGPDYSMSYADYNMFLSVEDDASGEEVVNYLVVNVLVDGLNSDIAITLEWQDGSGNKLDDTYTETSGMSSGEVPYLFLNLGIGGNKTYAAEELKIVIPDGAYLCPAKSGGYLPATYVKIPTGLASFTKIMISRQSLYNVVWDAYRDGNNLVLINNTAIVAGNYSLGIKMLYCTVGNYPANIALDMSRRNLEALVYDNDECTQVSNQLTYVYDSYAKLSVTGAATAWYKWNETWGDEPENYPSRDYVYGYYHFSVNEGDITKGDYPYQHTLLKTAVYSDAENIIGYTIGSNADDVYSLKNMSSFNEDIYGTNLTTEKYISFVVAYDRPTNETVEASMTLTATGAGIDGCDPDISSSDTCSVSFSAFNHEPDGYVFSKKTYTSVPDNTALIALENNIAVKEDFVIVGNICSYDMREMYGKLWVTITDGQLIKLGNETLVPGVDYTINIFKNLNASAYYESYTENVTGEMFLSNNRDFVKEYYDKEQDKWIICDDEIFPEDKASKFRYVIEGDEFDFANFKIYVRVTLHPTDHIKEIINGKSTVYLYNEASLSIKNEAGEELVTGGTDYNIKILRGIFYSQPFTTVNNYGNSLTLDKYVSGIFGLSVYAMPSTEIEKYALNKIKVYFTLPKYMTLDENASDGVCITSCEVQPKSIFEQNCAVEYIGEIDGEKIYSLDIDTSNYDETLYNLSVRVPYTYPVDAIWYYEKSPIINAAWMKADGSDIYFNNSNPGKLYAKGSSSYTDGLIPTNDSALSAVYVRNTLYDLSIFENLDGNGEANQISVAQGCINFTRYTPSSFESSFNKTAMGNSDSYYQESGTTQVGSEYRYRLKLSNSASTQRKNIIIYDNLEQGYGKNAHWVGTFLYVDADDCRLKGGCDPIIYYSIKTGLSSNTVPTKDELIDSDTWTVECPADSSKVTAVAVDFGDYILDVKDTVYVDIVMQAPARMMTDDGEALYAYNEAAFQSDGKDYTDTKWTSTLVQSANLAKVQLTEPDVSITKISLPESGTEDSPAAVYAGEDLSYDLTIENVSKYYSNKKIIVEDTFPEGLEVNSEITVSENGGDAVPIDKLGITAEWTANKVTLTIPLLSNGASYNFRFKTTVSQDAEAGEIIKNTAYITSIGDRDYTIESETTYHIVEDHTFKAGRGMKLMWTETNTGNKSVYSYANIKVFDLPDDTLVKIYNLFDCEQTGEGWYVPKDGAVPVGSIQSSKYHGVIGFSPDYVRTDSVILNGSIETETNAVGASHTQEYVLYLADGDLSGLNFSVSAEVIACQYRNNRDSDCQGFFDTMDIRLFGGE